MKRRSAFIAVAATISITAGSSIPAVAADAEQGYRYPSSCSVGTENRPAVTWLAMGSTILVTPPGYSGTVNDPLIYSSPGKYVGTKNGGLMVGGKWLVYSVNDVNQALTYGSCTS